MALEQDESLNHYIERVRRIPLLSREEEHDLAVRAARGDGGARDLLVQSNLRYVVAVALQYRRYGLRLGDLVAEGNLGLMTAVRKFDPERGTRFVTYAGYWIRAFVLEAVVRSTTMVGAGSGPFRSKLFFRLRRERARVWSLEQDPTRRLEVLAERFETTPRKMQNLLTRLDARDVSLDAQVFDDSGATLVESLPADGELADESLVRRQRHHVLGAQVSDALETLDDRERYIVEKRILGDDNVSLASLGRDLGVSRERARQLEARAKEKLRLRLEGFAPAA